MGETKLAVLVIALVAAALLKTFDAKFWGVVVMGLAVIILFFLPWLDTGPVRSGHYRPLFRKFFYLLVVDVLVLGYCGGAPAAEPYVMISQIASLYYFLHFLVILPIVSSIETPQPLPFSITEAVLGKDEHAVLSPTQPAVA
ncbi:MAG: hypothetical protein NTY32_02455 [Bacteroidia bacterium]|nr:hypothetical protein [Bacteroidia bacterium]